MRPLALTMPCTSVLLAATFGCVSTEHTSARPANTGLYLPEAAPAAASPAEVMLPDTPTLEACIQAALTAHPSLRAHHARWQELRATRRTVLRWQDPVLMYTFAPLPIETRLGAQRHIVALEQAIPWPGKQDLATRMIAKRADAEAAAFDAAYLQVRHDVTLLYWEVWHLERQLEVLARQQILLETIELGLRAQVEIGRRPASELARVGVTRVTLDERIRTLQTSARTSRIHLLAAMGSTTAPPDTSLVSSPPQAPTLEPVDALLESTSRPPHLVSLAHITRSKREALALAHLDARPGFKLGAQWSVISARDQMTAPEAGRDAVMLKVGVSLPVWRDAQHAQVDAAEAAIVASQSREAIAELEWASRLRVTHTRILEVERQLAVIQDTLLPMTRSAFEMARGDYEVERAELTAMLQSVEALLALDLETLALRTRLAQHLATWEWLTGAPIQTTPKDAP